MKNKWKDDVKGSILRWHSVEEEAYEKYGNLQKVVAMEEMSELIKEISKDVRGDLDRDNLIEELADVMIMLDQLKIIYRVSTEELYTKYDEKIRRLEKRLKGD